MSSMTLINIDGFLMTYRKSKPIQEQERYDIEIIFLCHGKHINHPFRYRGVSNSSRKEIIKKIRDYTSYNRHLKELSNSISLLTIVGEIERTLVLE